MAKQTGIGDRLYVEGYDLSGDVGAIDSLSTPREAIDVTAINQAAHDRILGLADVHVGFNAFYNDAAGRSHLALRNLGSTKRRVLYARGSTKGQKCLFFEGKKLNYDGARGADGSLLFKVDINGSEGNPPEWGELLTNALSTWSSSGVTASRDDAAASTNGLAAMLQLISKSATGAMTVSLQDSTDNALWTNLLSFTAIASGSSRAMERKTVAGKVNRYIRVDTSGTFGAAKLVVGTKRAGVGETAY